MAGILLTIIIAIGSLLQLMASNSAVGTRAEGFFGSVYFETVPVNESTFVMQVGVANLWPLALSTLILTIFSFAVWMILGFLKSYRASLVDKQ